MIICALVVESHYLNSSSLVLSNIGKLSSLKSLKKVYTPSRRIAANVNALFCCSDLLLIF